MADLRPNGGANTGVSDLRRRPMGFNHGNFYSIRDQVFHALFYRLAVFYSRSVSRSWRRAIEFLLLFEALLALVVLTYVHFAFNRDPVNCLVDISDSWSRDGVLRVEVLLNSSLVSNYTLADSYNKEFVLYGSDIEHSQSELSSTEVSNTTEDQSMGNNSGMPILDESSWVDGFLFDWFSWSNDKDSGHYNGTLLQSILELLFDNSNVYGEDMHIYEYANEFGLLRMSPKTRQKLKINTTLVVLDSQTESCFGNELGKSLLSQFLGYDDILLYSLKYLSGNRADKGYCRNVVTGDYYKFVDMSVSRLSYIPAAFLLVLFTTSISMLLRYSHQQIFIFMVDVLHVLDRTVFAMFPFAPLLTAVLALIGVETLISELFTEASTGFYVILIVWLADQYNVVCCHTVASKRHWIRFFYLYHFIFYAYHYRFNGHFSFVALMTSWLFIQHSMVYFFHHYELPAIEHQSQVNSLLARVRQQSPVRGLVTVISQTSPTEISRITLDTSTLSATPPTHQLRSSETDQTRPSQSNSFVETSSANETEVSVALCATPLTDQRRSGETDQTLISQSASLVDSSAANEQLSAFSGSNVRPTVTLSQSVLPTTDCDSPSVDAVCSAPSGQSCELSEHCDTALPNKSDCSQSVSPPPSVTLTNRTSSLLSPSVDDSEDFNTRVSQDGVEPKSAEPSLHCDSRS